MNNSYRPLRSLKEGHWFKLICGASFQHLPAIRSLTLAYALAGADCIDVAADPAVIEAARSALDVASEWAEVAQRQGFAPMEGLPWLMVSLNDGEDPHFRKAEFDPDLCPSGCPRPCEKICPASAIAFTPSFAGVLDNRCYGCGRCIPICPIEQIQARSYVYTPNAIAPLVLSGVDALEIHTQVGRFDDFQRLWAAISPYIHQLKLIAISCPEGDGREDIVTYLRSLYELISPLPCPLIWQTDGRPMSGDIGDGATRAAVKLGQKVLAANLPGYVQMAGGTNRHTVAKLRALHLLKEEDDSRHRSDMHWNINSNTCSELDSNINPGLDSDFNPGMPASIPTGIHSGIRSDGCSNVHSKTGLTIHARSYPERSPSVHAQIYAESATSQPLSRPYISGIAYGSYARVLLSPVIEQLENTQPEGVIPTRLEAVPALLWQAVTLADSLIAPLKTPMKFMSTSSSTSSPTSSPTSCPAQSH